MIRPRRDRWIGAGFSLASHLVVFLALFWPWRQSAAPVDLAPAEVALVKWPSLTVRAPISPSQVAQPQSAPPARRPPSASPATAAAAPSAASLSAVDSTEAIESGRDVDGLSDSALAGARDAGAAEDGGACDMARRLQDSLRRDRLVQAALIQVGAGRSLLVWNGGWVQSAGEDGKGLAAVREAILWEIGFAPPACRAQSVRGLILFSLSDARAARIVLGSDAWRWSDLLVPR